MRKWWLKLPLALVHLALGWLVLGWALPRYSAFVFIAGKSLTGTAVELLLLRLLRKPSVLIYVGSDSRPPYINGAMPARSDASLARATRRLKRRVKRMERWAGACVNAPGTAHFHEKPVVNWFAMGCARSLSMAGSAEHSSPPLESASSHRVSLVHSPSVPVVKGTDAIRSAVERLQRCGYQVDLVLLQGMPNQDVLRAIERCDLVVDQLYSDTPMAGLAIEAALLGKPVLVAGYFAPYTAEMLAGLPIPPTRFVRPCEFERALEALVNDASERRALGAAAKRFVESEWQCAQVARRLLRILDGDIPESWWLDPGAVRYLEGCGLHEDAARQRVRRLIDHGGAAALCLADKPALEQAFLRWALADATSNTSVDRAAQ
jgi:glycosyltransferase involved in cell wall biosynthesis